jgi:hypothetical protein
MEWNGSVGTHQKTRDARSRSPRTPFSMQAPALTLNPTPSTTTSQIKLADQILAEDKHAPMFEVGRRGECK